MFTRIKCWFGRAGSAGALVMTGLMLSAAGCHDDNNGPPPTLYTVSGIIQLNVLNPLTGGLPAGLTLSDGPESLTVAAASTTFAFSKGLASGAAYTVSVSASPAGLMCTASSNTGTITTDVTKVVVTCSDASYSVGGSVSGLTATGLVLTNNGGDALTVTSGASKFAFATALAFGSNYAVAVQTQPAGQTCSVAGGAGAVGAGDVTTVAVTCHANAFTLGGTISGLTTSGLVLANGANTLQIASGTTSFSFTQQVAYGGAYTVTVQTQPTGWQCTIANGTGTATAPVTNVQVSCVANTFTVGGTISFTGGSPVAGLVLSDNGTDTLTPAASASTFVFSKGVASGGHYVVTVTSAPTGLTCTVANAAGTIAAANITNVTVTCSTSGFSLGGTISGLNGTGLVLGNGTDTLSITSGATTFTFKDPVALGGNYSVTVPTQPSGQTCSVAGGTGTMVPGGVTSVAVTCGSSGYTLGGTITGLTATGLVLANGADMVSPPTGAATFTLPTRVASGGAYTVVVQTQPGGLSCQIANGSGTMPAANVTSIAVTCQPSGTTGSTFTISAGGTFTCALTAATGVDCWGLNGNGELGNGTVTNTNPIGIPYPVAVVSTSGSGTLTGIATLASGGGQTCAVTSSGALYCWGGNPNGELGNGTLTQSDVPTPVLTSGSTALSGIATTAGAVAAGAGHTCALTSAGGVLCWGEDSTGALGNGVTDANPDYKNPVAVLNSTGSASLSGIASIAAGGSATCALTTNQTALCWGNNDFGQLGNNTAANSNLPVTVLNSAGTAPLSGITQIVTDGMATCALTTAQVVWCWGYDGNGELGNGTNNSSTPNPLPVQVLNHAGTAPLSGITSISFGAGFACALTTGSNVYCWGAPGYTLGAGSAGALPTGLPIEVLDTAGSAPLGGIVAISAGEYNGCAVNTSGAVFCWGTDTYGALGNGTFNASEIPVQVLGIGGNGLLQL
jgi:alpha-tubulin suppressor-like RCC1 family protein